MISKEKELRVPLPTNNSAYIDLWISESIFTRNYVVNFTNLYPIGNYDFLALYVDYPSDGSVKSLAYGYITSIYHEGNEACFYSDVKVDDNQKYWLAYVSYDYKSKEYKVESITHNKIYLESTTKPRELDTDIDDPYISVSLTRYSGKLRYYCQLSWGNQRTTGKLDYVALCSSEPQNAGDHIIRKYQWASKASPYNPWYRWNSDYWIMYCSYCYISKKYVILKKAKAKAPNTDSVKNKTNQIESINSHKISQLSGDWSWHTNMVYQLMDMEINGRLRNVNTINITAEELGTLTHGNRTDTMRTLAEHIAGFMANTPSETLIRNIQEDLLNDYYYTLLAAMDNYNGVSISISPTNATGKIVNMSLWPVTGAEELMDRGTTSKINANKISLGKTGQHKSPVEGYIIFLLTRLKIFLRGKHC